jgi:hypothetical protein
LAEAEQCAICIDRRATVEFVPCGHVCCCAECDSKLATPKTCPICCAGVSSSQLVHLDGGLMGLI